MIDRYPIVEAKASTHYIWNEGDPLDLATNVRISTIGRAPPIPRKDLSRRPIYTRPPMIKILLRTSKNKGSAVLSVCKFEGLSLVPLLRGRKSPNCKIELSSRAFPENVGWPWLMVIFFIHWTKSRRSDIGRKNSLNAYQVISITTSSDTSGNSSSKNDLQTPCRSIV